MFALFRPQEVLSFDIIGSKSVTLWGHCLPNVQVRNEASVAIYIIPLILVVFKGLFYIIYVQNSSYEECHFRPYDPDEAIKLR